MDAWCLCFALVFARCREIFAGFVKQMLLIKDTCPACKNHVLAKTSLTLKLQVGSPQAEANKFYNTLRSSGYDQPYARELARLVRSLMKSTSSLQTRAGQQLNLKIDPGGNDMPLQHDERLLLYWKRFTDALSSRSKCSALTRFALNWIINLLNANTSL